jgi:molybdopterin molybdotransferase
VSAFVGFELFVQPALRKLGGHAEPGPRLRRLPLAEPFRSRGDRPTYHPARITDDLRVQPLPWFGSPDLRGLLTAEAFVIIPPGETDWPAGELVETVLVSSCK